MRNDQRSILQNNDSRHAALSPPGTTNPAAEPPGGIARRATAESIPQERRLTLGPGLVLVILLLFLQGVVAQGTAAAADGDAEAERRWGDAIRAFEAADREEMPPVGGIVFVGSSSIRRWNLRESFPDVPVINRGFGGSQVSDTLHFVDRIVLVYKPRVVVLYAGDNDIAAGESHEQVVADFQQLVSKVHAADPEMRILFIAIKPSLARWEIYEKMHTANRMIQAVCEDNDRLTFVDVATPMLNEDGRPREELFVDDNLHLSEDGYELWTELVRPHLVSKTRREPE